MSLSRSLAGGLILTVMVCKTSSLFGVSPIAPAIAMGFNPTQTVLKTRCPALKQYQAALVKKLGAELRGAPPDAAWPGFITDYRVLRLQCKAIEN